MEEIIYRNYSNLNMFVRDLNLSDTLYEMYEENQILKEVSFVDLTYKLGGIGDSTNTRFIVLSNKATDLQELEQDTSWGLYVLGRNSYFKVIGKFEISGKRGIILLHISINDIKFMEENTISLDDGLKYQVTNLFNTWLNTPVIPELMEDIWLKRVNYPIGIDEQSNFFPL